MKHVIHLDGIRGMAIASVVVFHMSPLLGDGYGRSIPLIVAQRFFLTGWLGVEMFFVLSGFLITGIILKERFEPNFWTSFYLRRSLRILPAFAVVFFVTLAAAHFLLPEVRFPTGSVFMSIFFLANWTVITASELPMLGHMWSLAIEEQFYLLWPQAKRLSQASMFKLAVALASGCVVLRIVFAVMHVNAWIAYKVTLTNIDGLAIGAALAAGLTIPRVKQFLSQRWLGIASAAGGIVAAAFVLFHGSLFVFNIWSQVIAIPAVEILVAMLIYASVESALPGVLAAFLGHPVMTWLGKRSYGLYLIHVPILSAVEMSRHGGALSHLPSGFAANCSLAFFAIAASLALTELSWRLIELPAQNLRRVLLAKIEPATA